MSQTINKPLTPPQERQKAVTRTPWYKQRRTREYFRNFVVYLLVLPGAAIFILPLLWMLSTALKESNQIFVYPPQWIPDPMVWSNFTDGWSKFLDFNQMMLNTLFITTNNVIGNLVSCCLAAYGFARLRAPGKNILFALVLGTMLLPAEVTIIPQYVMFTKLGWNNSWLPLTVPAWFGFPFFIFLLRQFFMSIPYDLDEAARIDGASSWRILWSVILPLAKPALATVVIFAFIGNWNNFLNPLIYIRDMDKQVLSVGLNMFRGQYGRIDFHYMMAVALIVLMPVLVVFFFGQRLFVQGIALTGIKG